MGTSLWRVMVSEVLVAWLGGCADGVVDLRYTPSPTIDR